MNNHTGKKHDAGFKTFATIRIVFSIALIAALIWGLTYGLDYLETTIMSRFQSDKTDSLSTTDLNNHQIPLDMNEIPEFTSPYDQEISILLQEEDIPPSEAPAPNLPEADHSAAAVDEPAVAASVHEDVIKKDIVTPDIHTIPQTHEKASLPAHLTGETDQPPAEPHAPSVSTSHTEKPETASHRSLGVTFVQAAIEPLEYELKHRWWGWRPNDIINLTDNVNNYQLGVLEVTRRTAVQLAERISRTGSTAAFNPHLENAMNWIMVSPDKYWFPSPESKYKDSLDEMAIYKNQLIEHQATFYTRSDNIIPLLAAFEDLLGSCDENLVKAMEKDGSKVGFFTADNYFYYAKGIASTMLTILEAMNHDFTDVLEKRNGAELLHHAIESCRRAAELSPWLITNGALDDILANHRANMAAPISHAKFYLSQLIKTLST